MIWASLGNHDHLAHLLQESWHVCRSKSCFDYVSSLAFDLLKPDWLQQRSASDDAHKHSNINDLQPTKTSNDLAMTCDATLHLQGVVANRSDDRTFPMSHASHKRHSTVEQDTCQKSLQLLRLGPRYFVIEQLFKVLSTPAPLFLSTEYPNYTSLYIS